MTKINCYLLDLKVANLKLKQAEELLDADAFNKKKYAEYKKALKKQEEVFNKFADELARLMKRERNNKFDLYITLNLEKIEEMINM